MHHLCLISQRLWQQCFVVACNYPLRSTYAHTLLKPTHLTPFIQPQNGFLSVLLCICKESAVIQALPCHGNSICAPAINWTKLGFLGWEQKRKEVYPQSTLRLSCAKDSGRIIWPVFAKFSLSLDLMASSPLWIPDLHTLQAAWDGWNKPQDFVLIPDCQSTHQFWCKVVASAFYKY